MWLAYARWMWRHSATPVSLKSDPVAAMRCWTSFSEYWTFRDGVPESEFLFLQQVNRTSDRPVAIDIGANIGLFTLELAHLGFEVHAFEPVPTTFARLKKNVEAISVSDPSVIINQSACGDREGTVQFAINERSAAQNHIAVPGNDGGTLVEVTCTTLDAYCAHVGIATIDFLKVDVEGMEPSVIRGAAELLRGHRVGAMLIEICPANLTNVHSSIDELLATVEDLGYGLFELAPSGLPAGRLDLSTLKQTILCNAVAFPVGVRHGQP